MEDLVKIARAFDKLLVGVGVANPNYSVHLDREQGAGFFPLDSDTRAGVSMIDRDSYNALLDGLLDVAKGLEFGKGMNINRDAVYRL